MWKVVVFLYFVLWIFHMLPVSSFEIEMGRECNLEEEVGYWGYRDTYEVVCIVRNQVESGYIFDKMTFTVQKCPENSVEFISESQDEAKYPPTTCIEIEDDRWWLGWTVAGGIILLLFLILTIMCCKLRQQTNSYTRIPSYV